MQPRPAAGGAAGKPRDAGAQAVDLLLLRLDDARERFDLLLQDCEVLARRASRQPRQDWQDERNREQDQTEEKKLHGSSCALVTAERRTALEPSFSCRWGCCHLTRCSCRC